MIDEKGPPFDLPDGARWAGDNRKPWEFPWMFRPTTPWWRYYGQTTVYVGRYHTPVAYCDTEAVANEVIRRKHPDLREAHLPESGEQVLVGVLAGRAEGSDA